MTRQISEQNKGWSYTLTAQALWGTGGIAIKLVDKALPGSLLVGIRHGIGSLVLGLTILKGRRRSLKNLPWVHLILLGLLAALPDLLLIAAIRRVGAIIAVIVIRLEIPLVVLFAHFLLKEKVGLNAYAAAILSLLGACLMSAKPGQAISLENRFTVGVLLALGGAILWALSGVYAKFLINKKTDPLGLTFMRLGIGSIFMLSVSAFTLPSFIHAIKNIALADWGLVIYLGIFLSGLAYLMYYKSMTVLDAHVGAIMLSVSLAVLLTLGLIIGERISLLQWLGIIFVFLSVYLVRPKPEAEPLGD